MKGPVLIISYKFPPYEGVGARRWVKFVKYFLAKEKKVIVVTNNWKQNGKNSWTHDISKSENLVIEKFHTPFALLKFKNSFLNKIMIKIEYLLSNKFLWTDESYLFFKINYSKIKSLIIENNIKYVVATGGPFSANYFAAKLKEEMPHIFLVQDFRDLWTEEYFFEYPSRDVNHPFYDKEKKMEEFALKHNDLIVSVTPGYLERLQKKAESLNLCSKNYALIENGFDNDDKASFDISEYPTEIFNKDDINISHFGTLGFGREEAFLKFLTSIKSLLKNNTKKIRFHLFGNNPKKLVDEVNALDLGNVVSFYSFIPPKEVQRYMYFSSMHLVVNDKIWHYAFGTKVYDAFMYEKPILLICKEGPLYERLEYNNLGIVTNNTDNLNEAAVNFLLQNHSGILNDMIFNKSYDFNKYSIKNLTDQYLNYFN